MCKTGLRTGELNRLLQDSQASLDELRQIQMELKEMTTTQHREEAGWKNDTSS